jgi:Spy/CpxP family protein refolding chaperone
MRLALVPMMLLALTTVALADDKAEGKSKHSGNDMAAKMAKMEKELKITADQKPQFEQVMSDSHQKMMDAKKDAAGDKDKMKASMASIRADQDAALAKILTPDQMKIYNEKMEKMKAEGKKKMEKASKDAKEDAKEDKK